MNIKRKELTFMKDITKKVVILNNFSSPYISEAIIVLREYNPKLEGRIIDEAEKIVADYIDTHTVKTITKENKKERLPKLTAHKMRQKKRPHFTLSALIIIAALAIIGLFLRII